jgi:hypothetical protein
LPPFEAPNRDEDGWYKFQTGIVIDHASHNLNKLHLFIDCRFRVMKDEIEFRIGNRGDVHKIDPGKISGQRGPNFRRVIRYPRSQAEGGPGVPRGRDAADRLSYRRRITGWGRCVKSVPVLPWGFRNEKGLSGRSY